MLSYSRPNNFRGFNANSETSCIFIAIAISHLSVRSFDTAVTAVYCKRNCSGLTFITCVLNCRLSDGYNLLEIA